MPRKNTHTWSRSFAYVKAIIALIWLKQSSQVNRSFINYILKLCSAVCPSKCTMCAAQHRINSYSNERYGISSAPNCKLFGAFACSSKSLLAFRQQRHWTSQSAFFILQKVESARVVTCNDAPVHHSSAWSGPAAACGRLDTWYWDPALHTIRRTRH